MVKKLVCVATAKKLYKGFGMERARLEEVYKSKIRADLKNILKLDNVMEVPEITKIVLNVGVKESVADSKALQKVQHVLSRIAGQAPLKTYAKKSIAGFKIREGMSIGAMVTLRRRNMYEFLDKLISLALPRVRDFQGVPTKFDRQGNYNLGLKDWTIFPEADSVANEIVHGLNITICTTARSDAHGFELLKQFGMPFRRA
jgi:large subunit ribosomal protein L5